MTNYNSFPQKLREQKQWVLWKIEKVPGKEKPTKVPYKNTAQKAASTNPDDWLTFEECKKLLETNQFDGLGYVFKDGKGIVGIDLDDCFKEDGSLKDWAIVIVNKFQSCYMEISPSGTGIHIILECDIEFTGKKIPVHTPDGKSDGAIERYMRARYFTVTGNVYEGHDKLNVFPAEDFLEWHNSLIKKENTKTENFSYDNLIPEDKTIIEAMRKGKNREKFIALYDNGDWQSQGFDSQSQADMSLVSSLMFFCRNNTVAVDRIFRTSKLMRDKWERDDYREGLFKECFHTEVMEWAKNTKEDDEGKTDTKGQQRAGIKLEKDKLEYSSHVYLKDGLAELVYSPKTLETKFAVYKNGQIEYKYAVEVGGKIIKPFPGNKDILKTGVVLFPSTVEKFASEEELLKEIQSFIHRYLDVDEFYEKIASYYVPFTWIYDDFNELPYLRALGDYGSGKTRFLQVIGSICYKPIFAGGATTVSPIFRILNDYKGTLILDEADYRFSDSTSEIIKILNNGFARGFPVLRSEGKGKFEVRAFDVFSPKIIGTRGRFTDKALESRFLIQEMEKGKLREDIPLNLPDIFWDEATAIRNKLLYWRFINKGKIKIKTDIVSRKIEPRLNQIISPLMSIIQDAKLVDDLKDFIEKYNSEIISDRGMELDCQVLEAILELNKDYPLSEITMKKIEEKFNSGVVNLNDKITGKKIGSIVREKLKLKTKRGRNGYYLLESNKEKIENLKNKFGIIDNGEHVNDVNVARGIPVTEEHANEPI